MADKDIQQKIEDKLKELNLTEDDLTLEELEKLKEETITEMNGGMILDGVLSNPEIVYRKLSRKETTDN